MLFIWRTNWGNISVLDYIINFLIFWIWNGSNISTPLCGLVAWSHFLL